MASTSLLALITTSLIYHLTSSQTICLWGRDGYNGRISGPYTQQNNYNNKSYYGKTWGSGCDTFYIYWTGSRWAVHIDLGTNYPNIYAYCQSSSTLTNCQNWYVWSGSSWGLDSAVSISNGSCPTCVCDTITINNAPNNCGSFTVALGNNIWRNSGSTRWWYFDPYYYSWRCTDYAPYACDRFFWTRSEEGWDELSKGESMSITLLHPSTQTRTLNCVAGPTTAPTKIPTNIPSNMPLKVPTKLPSLMPSENPTYQPTVKDNDAEIISVETTAATGYIKIKDNIGKTDSNDIFWVVMGVLLAIIICCVVFIVFTIRHKLKKEQRAKVMSVSHQSQINLHLSNENTQQIGGFIAKEDVDGTHTIPMKNVSIQDTNSNPLSSNDGNDTHLKDEDEEYEHGQNTLGAPVNNMLGINNVFGHGSMIPVSVVSNSSANSPMGSFDAFLQNGNEELIKIKKWLTGNGMQMYYGAFITNGYGTLDIIRNIESKTELQEIGILLKGHQTKLWVEIKKLKRLYNGNDIDIEHNILLDEEVKGDDDNTDEGTNEDITDPPTEEGDTPNDDGTGSSDVSCDKYALNEKNTKGDFGNNINDVIEDMNQTPQ